LFRLCMGPVTEGRGDCMVSWEEVMDMAVFRFWRPPRCKLGWGARCSTPEVSRSLLSGPAIMRSMCKRAIEPPEKGERGKGVGLNSGKRGGYICREARMTGHSLQNMGQ